MNLLEIYTSIYNVFIFVIYYLIFYIVLKNKIFDTNNMHVLVYHLAPY